MQQCEEKGVKAVNIITSGFAEIGGGPGDIATLRAEHPPFPIGVQVAGIAGITALPPQ
jgi:hypothetical protein